MAKGRGANRPKAARKPAGTKGTAAGAKKRRGIHHQRSTPALPEAGGRPGRDFSMLDECEKTSLLLHHAREGNGERPKALAARLNRLYTDAGFTAQSFAKHVMKAATDGRLIYDAPQDPEASDRLHKALELRDCLVVRTARPEDVARRAARRLLKLVQSARAAGRDEVHIGLAGGYTTGHIAQHFAELLRQRHKDLPRRLVFHTMVAGFDISDPMTDPAVFCSYFARDPQIRVQVGFKILHASATVRCSDFESQKRMPGIQEVYEAARDLHVIVTSAAQWDDEHSTLAGYYQRSPASYARLKDDLRCVGDILWRPLGPAGPIDDHDLEIRAMTLMDLEHFPEFIDQGGSVLLALGPCHACGMPRPRILQSLHAYRRRLISDLVVDSRTAAEFRTEPG